MCEGSYEAWERFREKTIEGFGLDHSRRDLGHVLGGKVLMKKKLKIISSHWVKQDFPYRFSLFLSHVRVKLFCLILSQTFRHQRRVITAFMLACASLHKSQNRLFISSREGELDYFSPMPFVWRKRCWLTAELLDPTQPGFNADAWLMRSTTGIIIRQGILAFSCVSQAGKTSQCCNVKVGISASV